MTSEESKAWFEEAQWDGTTGKVEEQRYQAFKCRLLDDIGAEAIQAALDKVGGR